MQAGLLIQGIVEAGLGDRIRQLSPEESKNIRRQMLTTFATKEGPPPLSTWEYFTPSAAQWIGVEESLSLAIKALGTLPRTLWVLEEPWRDPTVIELDSDVLQTLVSEAWYPSDDVYICDQQMRWCLVLTHHDVLALYRQVH